MQARSKAILLGSVVVMSAVAVITSWSKKDSGSGLQCEWHSDLLAAYRLKVQSNGEFDEGAMSGGLSTPAKKISLQYEANLGIRALTSAERQDTYVASLILSQGLENREFALRNDLARPFTFRMDSNCRFQEFGFDANEGRESRELKKGLLLVMEAITPSKEKASSATWEVTQTDATGDYVASYRRNPGGDDISRNRLFYAKTSSTAGSLQLKAEVDKSLTTFVPHPDFWLERIRVHESIRLVDKTGKTVVRTIADIDMEPGDRGIASNLTAHVQDLQWEKATVIEVAEMKASTYDHIEETTTTAAMTLAEAMAKFAKGDFYSGRIDREAMGELINYLKAHPGAAAEILNQVKSGQVDQALHAFVFFAYSRAGTPEVQRALTQAMNDGEFTVENRILAIHALAEVPKPLPESLEALVSMAQTFASGGEDNTLESTALLALGVVTKQQAGGEFEAIGKRANDVLVEKIKSNVSEEERGVLLEALANTGNLTHSGLITEQFENESSSVRVSAARSLARLGPPEADQVLMDAVDREKNPAARREIAEAWAGRTGPSGTFDTGKLASLMTGETNDQVRHALITVLGREAASQPRAKTALADQFGKETSAKLKYKIGTYLKADELR